MNAKNATCPPESVLSDFGLGKLDAARTETVSRHLDTCTDCRDRVAGLSGDSFVDRLRNVQRSPPPEAERPGSASEKSAAPVTGLAPDDSPPAELANHPDYELLKELGRGGMGVVYLARNKMMDRLEVLKVVNKALLDRPGALERFQQEIRSAARLSHANIVAAHSVLRLDSLLVFVMEYVDGEDLAEVVKRRGALPVAHAAFYAHQVALGLQHAHEKGMVHRDIKPNNLMLAVDAKKHVVKILDFGLAKATSEKGADGGLTKVGQILGTPDYLAPEQTLNAQKADIRADIYSLGCTLYYLLSGAPPFQEASLYEILKAHQAREAKRLNLVRREVPFELAAIVAKMMAKDPAKRYQTPIEVARALAPFFKPGQTWLAAEPRSSASKVEPPPVAAESPPQVERPAAVGPRAPAIPSVPRHRPLPIPLPPRVSVPNPVLPPTPDCGITIVTRRRAPRATVRRSWWAPDSPRQRLAAAAGGAALLLLLGIMVIRPTKETPVVSKFPKDPVDTPPVTNDQFLEENKKKEGVKTTKSGLQYKVLKRGHGASPKATDTVVVNYRGTFIDGGEFDSSYRRNQAATYPVNGVIKGWAEAIQKMHVGDKWRLFIPAELGYGAKGAKDSVTGRVIVPPNSALIFEVELLAITGVNLSYVPADAVAAFVVRPAAILRQKGTESLVKALNKEVGWEARLGMPIEALEEIKFAYTDLGTGGMSARGKLVFRSSRPLDWKKLTTTLFRADQAATARQTMHAGTTYYVMNPDTAFHMADDRTLVITGQSELRELIEESGKPETKTAWAERWEQTSGSQLTVIVDTAAYSAHTKTNGAANLPPNLRSFSALWERSRELFVDLRFDDGLAVDVSIHCADAASVEKVRAAADAALIAASTALDGLRNQRAAVPDKAAASLSVLSDLGTRLIKEGKRTSDGTTVRWQSKIELNVTDTLTKLLPILVSAAPAPVVDPIPAAPQPRDTNQMSLALDERFDDPLSGPRGFDNEFALAKILEGEFKLVGKMPNVFVRADLRASVVDDFVCEIEGRLNAPAAGGWGLMFGFQDLKHWFGASLRNDARAGFWFAGEMQPNWGVQVPMFRSINEKNKLRVEVTAQSFRLFVNDQFITETTDPRYRPDGLQLGVLVSQPPVDARFERVRLWIDQPAEVPKDPPGKVAGRQAVDKAIADMVRKHGAERVATINVQGLPDAEITIVQGPNNKTVSAKNGQALPQQGVHERIRALSGCLDSAASVEPDGFSIAVAPIDDLDKLAAKLDFGSVPKVDDVKRVITMRVDPKKIAELSASAPAPPNKPASEALIVNVAGSSNHVYFREVDDRPDTGVKTVAGVDENEKIHVLRGQPIVVNLAGVGHKVYMSKDIKKNVEIHDSGVNNTVVEE